MTIPTELNPAVDLRKPSGSLKLPYFEGDNYNFSLTEIDFKEELWLMLRHPSEVFESGKKILYKRAFKDQSPSETEMLSAWERFRSYIRRAESFFRGAETLDWKSAPLNYYYSFLNLVKAYLLTMDKNLPERIHHGFAILTPDKSTHINGQFVVVQQQDEVFTKLFESESKQRIDSQTRLSVIAMLGYISSIGSQYVEAGYGGNMRHTNCVRALLTTGEGEAIRYWELIAVATGFVANHWPDFLDKYEKVKNGSLLKNIAREIFALNATVSNQLDFFQTKHLPESPFTPSQSNQGLKEMFNSCVSPCYATDKFQFGLNIPYEQDGRKYRMNEFLAIYVFMFFLSSLVRYYPEHLDRLAPSADAWLIESFVKSVPLHFLRIIASKILDRTIILARP